jgi:hypothetical protein
MITKHLKRTIFISLILIGIYVGYKVYQYDRIFMRDDFHEMSLLHNANIKDLFRSDLLDSIDDEWYVEYVSTVNEFKAKQQNFYSDQLFFEKVNNADLSVTYLVGLKGEDNAVGGRKYYYLGNEDSPDVKKESFLKYIFKSPNYDIVIAAQTLEYNDSLR